MNSNLRNLLRVDGRAMSRLFGDSEDFREKATMIVNSIFQYSGIAYMIGITGPPRDQKKREKGRNNCHRSFIPIFWRSFYGN